MAEAGCGVRGSRVQLRKQAERASGRADSGHLPFLEVKRLTNTCPLQSTCFLGAGAACQMLYFTNEVD